MRDTGSCAAAGSPAPLLAHLQMPLGPGRPEQSSNVEPPQEGLHEWPGGQWQGQLPLGTVEGNTSVLGKHWPWRSMEGRC